MFLFVTGIVEAGCSRKMAQADIAVGSDDSYDKAKFDYVYVEGIKQKLMGNGGEALKYSRRLLKLIRKVMLLITRWLRL